MKVWKIIGGIKFRYVHMYVCLIYYITFAAMALDISEGLQPWEGNFSRGTAFNNPLHFIGSLLN